MPTYSPEQIAKAIISEWAGTPGFKPNKKADKPTVDLIAEGVGVVMGESGGRSHAVSSTGCCYGPWQINIRDDHKGVSVECATGLRCSTKFAHKLWKDAGGRLDPWRSGFSRDWVAWNEGIGTPYQEMVMEVLKAPGGSLTEVGIGGGLGINNPFDFINDVADALKAIIAFIARLFEPSFWVRVGKAILGFVMVVAGLAALGRALLGVDLPRGAEALAGSLAGIRGGRGAEGGAAAGAPAAADVEATEYAKVRGREAAKLDVAKARMEAETDEAVKRAVKFREEIEKGEFYSPEEKAQ